MTSTSWFLACVLCCSATANMASLPCLTPYLEDDVTTAEEIITRCQLHVFLRQLENAAFRPNGERGHVKHLLRRLIGANGKTPAGLPAVTFGGRHKSGDSVTNHPYTVQASAAEYERDVELPSQTPTTFLDSAELDSEEHSTMAEGRARSRHGLSLARIPPALAVAPRSSSHLSPQLGNPPHGQRRPRTKRVSRGPLDTRVAGGPWKPLPSKRTLPQLSTLNDLSTLATMIHSERDRKKVEFFKYIFEDMLKTGR